MGEVEHMLAPLARQAEKTKKYRELYEELKHNEINLYIYKHDNAESARSAIRVVTDRLQGQIGQSRAQVESLEEKYASDRRRIAEIDELLQKLNEQILRYTVDLQKKEGDAKVIRERISFFKEQQKSEENAVSEFSLRASMSSKKS